jgi:hypothetical protein
VCWNGMFFIGPSIPGPKPGYAQAKQWYAQARRAKTKYHCLPRAKFRASPTDKKKFELVPFPIQSGSRTFAEIESVPRLRTVLKPTMSRLRADWCDQYTSHLPPIFHSSPTHHRYTNKAH